MLIYTILCFILCFISAFTEIQNYQKNSVVILIQIKWFKHIKITLTLTVLCNIEQDKKAGVNKKIGINFL